jgi:hypothetical protein
MVVNRMLPLRAVEKSSHLATDACIPD